MVSPGSTCFFVHSPHGKRYLFTGDTLYLNKAGNWSYTPPEERPVLAESLRLLATLEPDVVFCSAFASAGFQEMSPDSWAGLVDGALDRLLL